MPHAALRSLAGLLALLACLHAAADPSALNRWEAWVLEKHPDSACPWEINQNTSRVCLWPGQLDFEMTGAGMQFSYQVEVFQDDALVPLPGSADTWPLKVTTNESRANVVDRAGSPHALLNRGKHTLRGQFLWQRRPASLAIPESIALVSVHEGGQLMRMERRGSELILGRDNTATAVKQNNTLDIEVYRKLTDGVPMTLETRLVMTVSGEPREVQVGQLAWPGTALMAIESPLPARVENNGNLRVQLAAGRHTLVVNSRFLQAAEQFSPRRLDEQWPAFEYLSFAGDSDLRQVKLTGAPSIDTSQVAVPADWKELPTWRLSEDTPLQLATDFRGDQSPATNILSVTRNLWLDFDGGALTGLESVNGSMRRDWRLDAQADTQLGSAQVSGKPVLITEHAGAEGVEIRSPEITLQAVTRIDSPTHFSATGWDSRADDFNATLHIPPGWRVLHATGVDDVRGTWLSGWDLWDIFLLLIIMAATRKLLGLKAAALAVAALLIGYQEPGMPTGLLAALLLLLPLSAIARGRVRRSIAIAAVLTGVSVVLALVAFSISNFRLAIYPSLERSSVGAFPYGGQNEIRVSGISAADSGDFMLESSGALPPQASVVRKLATDAPAPRQPNAYLLGENDQVQTGPGVPNWLWNTVSLSASSPLPESAQLSIVYSPPWLTSVWRVLSVLLVAAYAGLLLSSLLRNLRAPPPDGEPSQRTPQSPASASPAAAVLLMLGLGLALGSVPEVSQAQDYPPAPLLKELEQRLLQPPSCAPHCLALDQGVISTSADSLTIGFSAYAAADMLLQLPTPREGWRVSAIQVDGREDTAARMHAGYLAVRLTQGHHVVSVTGALEGEIASVSLPGAIHNITATGAHWQLSGLVDGRVPSGTLSLRAMSAARQEAGASLKPDPIEPFFAVHREFDIGLQWRVVTRVTRLAPASGPVAVNVKLLAFERPLSNAISFTEGRARLQFSERQQQISWESSVTPADSLQLVAAAGDRYVETWRLRPSALWRVTHDGLPATRAPEGLGSLQPLWKPWPGESLTLNFSRPEGVAGPTYTVEQANLAYQASSALRQSLLTLNIKASIGQDYVFVLPEDARVTSLNHNGSNLNVPDGPSISVALQPGEQMIAVTFEQEGGISWLNTTPTVTLPGGASNITLTYTLPQDRWPLYLTGPRIGPAMLYWGVFCVIVLGAVLLGVLNRRLQAGIPVSLLGWLLLGIGLSTVNSYGVLVVAAFFFVLAFRQRLEPESMSRLKFNLMQVALGLGALITLVTLVSAIPLGLLSSPNMLVTGNNSWSHLYNFFQDRAAPDTFPTATVVSVNLMIYRAVMLIWSLWLANRLLRWVAWSWQAYGTKGVWRGK